MENSSFKLELCFITTEDNFELLFKYFICRESDITKERIQKILSTGANVILTTGGIDDMCLKYFVETGAMAVRRVLKRDLKRIAKASGGVSSACLQMCFMALSVGMPTLKSFKNTLCLLFNDLCSRYIYSHFSCRWKSNFTEFFHLKMTVPS